MFEENIRKAKAILKSLEEMEKDYAFSGAPVSTSSVGYLNPMFTSYKHKKKKKDKIIQEEPYLR